MAFEENGNPRRYMIYPVGSLILGREKPKRIEFSPNRLTLKTAEVRRTLLDLQEGQSATILTNGHPEAVIIREADIAKFQPKTSSNIKCAPDQLAEDFSKYTGELQAGNTVTVQDYIPGRQYSVSLLPSESALPKNANRISGVENRMGVPYINDAVLKSSMLRLQDSGESFVIFTDTKRFVVELLTPGDLEKVEEIRRQAREQAYKREGLDKIIRRENEHMPASNRRAPYIAQSQPPATGVTATRTEISLGKINCIADRGGWSKIPYNGTEIIVIAATHIPEAATLRDKSVRIEHSALTNKSMIKLADATLGEGFGTKKHNTLHIYTAGNGIPSFAIATADLEELLVPENYEADAELDETANVTPVMNEATAEERTATVATADTESATPAIEEEQALSPQPKEFINSSGDGLSYEGLEVVPVHIFSAYYKEILRKQLDHGLPILIAKCNPAQRKNDVITVRENSTIVLPVTASGLGAETLAGLPNSQTNISNFFTDFKRGTADIALCRGYVFIKAEKFQEMRRRAPAVDSAVPTSVESIAETPANIALTETATIGPATTKPATVNLALQFLRAARQAQKGLPCPMGNFIVTAQTQDRDALQEDYSFQTLCDDGKEQAIPVIELDIARADKRAELKQQLASIFENANTKIAIIRFNDNSPDVAIYKPAFFTI